MHLLSQVNRLFLLLLLGTILCHAKYFEYNQINEEDSMQSSRSRMVSLRYDCQDKNDPTTHCCSGIIHSKSYILTAADCVDSFPSDITIVVGIHNRSGLDQTSGKVDQIMIHPNWKKNHDDFKYNIALVHVSNSLDFRVNKHITRTFSPIDLNYPSNSTRLLVIQWNSVKQNFEVVNLQQNEMSVVDDRDQLCKGSTHDIQQQFCVRFYHASKSLLRKRYQ